MIEWVILSIFAVWYLLSWLVLLPRFGTFLRSVDVLYFLPDFKFFAPTPGQQDFHILYRDRFPDGSITEWTEVEPLQDRRPWHALWNEGKRGNKARLDLAVALSTHLVEKDTTLPLSIPYLMLLNHVSSIPRPLPPHATQFLLMQSTGSTREKKYELLYASDLHPL